MNKIVSSKTVSQEELKALQFAKQNAQQAIMLAEKYYAESKALDLNYQNIKLKLYVKYGLSEQDNLDDNTGTITLALVKEKDTSKEKE